MASFNSTVSRARGFSLVESLILIGVLAFLFVGVFYSFRTSLVLIAENRAHVTAMSLANDRIEYIRSLSYNAVGTNGGIPPGAIPQVSTTTANGIDFTERVLIEYVDDPADGQGAADANGITTDYKRARVSYEWDQFGAAQDVVLTTNIVPRSIESNVGGGTLRVNVFDAAVQPLSGAEVRIVNDGLSPKVDLVRYTNSDGVALIGGAPAGPDYELEVTDVDHSIDRTYRATSSLPNPDTSPVTVVEADVTTMNFFIDELSEVEVYARSAEVTASEDRLANSSGDIATSSAVVVGATSTRLTSTGSGYKASGEVVLQWVAPSAIEEWDAVRVQASTTAGTEIRTRVYAGTSTATLIPEADLPGNTVGFTGNIPIVSLDPATYPELTIATELRSNSGTSTPTLTSVAVDYTSSFTPAPSTDLVLRSDKRIGTNSSGEDVPKHEYAGTTDGSGEWQVPNVEWDAYTIVPPAGSTVAKACPSNPLVVEPDTTVSADVVVVPATAHSLRVRVEESDGTPVVGAAVTVSDGGTPRTETTGSCGQVYFSGLTEADYTVSADIAGQPDPPDGTVPVSGDTYHRIGL
jgi:type II secretory pathway pseudopilin PulG